MYFLLAHLLSLCCLFALTLGFNAILLRFKIGESFFHLPAEETSAKIDEQKTQLKDRLITLESDLSDCRATMATLKKELYAKFGDNINLEDS